MDTRQEKKGLIKAVRGFFGGVKDGGKSTADGAVASFVNVLTRPGDPLSNFLVGDLVGNFQSGLETGTQLSKELRSGNIEDVSHAIGFITEKLVEVAVLKKVTGGKSGSSGTANGTAVTEVISKSKGTFGGERAGKNFTKGMKKTESEANSLKNGGAEKCESCGVKVLPAKKSEKGVTPPKNERRYDHIYPRSRGGDGSGTNIQVLCDGCNTTKSDRLPITQRPGPKRD